MLVATLTAQAMADAVRAAVTRNRFERIPTPLDTVRPTLCLTWYFVKTERPVSLPLVHLQKEFIMASGTLTCIGVIAGTHSRSGLRSV
jgi:hypothetical protein